MANRSALVLLLLANAISGVAQGISMLAIPWYFARAGDMGRFGLLYVLTNVISFFWVPYAGTLIDRFNRKHLFLALTTISGLVLLATGGAGAAQGGLPWYIVGGIFGVTFLNYNLHFPTLYAFVQELVEPRYYDRITSILEVMNQSTSVLAGAGAALLLEGTENGLLKIFGFQMSLGWDFAPWKIYDIFLLDGSTYVLAFLIILSIRYISLKPREPEKGNMLQRLRTGFLWLKGHPDIFLFGVASYSVFVTTLLLLFYLGAKYVSDHLLLGGDVYAASEMYFAVGSLLAGALIQRLFNWTTQPVAIFLTTLVSALVYLVLAGTKMELLFYGMIFLFGFCNAGTRVLRVTYLFSHIPNQVYGRCGSIFFLTNIIFRTLFLLLFALPFFQESNHVVYAFATLAVFLFLTAWVFWIWKDLFSSKPLLD